MAQFYRNQAFLAFQFNLDTSANQSVEAKAFLQERKMKELLSSVARFEVRLVQRQGYLGRSEFVLEVTQTCNKNCQIKSDSLTLEMRDGDWLVENETANESYYVMSDCDFRELTGTNSQNLSEVPKMGLSIKKIGTPIEKIGEFQFTEEYVNGGATLNAALRKAFPEMKIAGTGLYWDGEYKVNEKRTRVLTIRTVIDNAGSHSGEIYSWTLRYGDKLVANTSISGLCRVETLPS